MCVGTCVSLLYLCVNETREVSNLMACSVCRGENEGADFLALTRADPPFRPSFFSSPIFSSVFESSVFFNKISVFFHFLSSLPVCQCSLCLCLSLLFPFSILFRRVHCSFSLLSIPLSSLPLSDFQSWFIRFSGLAFFLQHTPLPPELIGFHYRQGGSAHTHTHTLSSIPLRTHSNTHRYLSPLSGFYLQLWPSSISICVFFLSLRLYSSLPSPKCSGLK